MPKIRKRAPAYEAGAARRKRDVGQMKRKPVKNGIPNVQSLKGEQPERQVA